MRTSVGVAMHTERAAYVGMGNGVIVEIEARVRGLADGDGDLRRPWEGVVWQRQQLAASRVKASRTVMSLPGQSLSLADAAHQASA